MRPLPKTPSAAALLALALMHSGAALSQEAVKALPLGASDGTEPKKELRAGYKTDKEARTFRLSIPAPRGQIVDRKGVPLAQSRVAKYLSLIFPYVANATDEQILGFARQRIDRINQMLGKKWGLSDEKLLSHYKNRRWLPIIFSITDGLNDELSPEQIERIQPLLTEGNGLVLQPVYLRVYPKRDAAPHIIGYTQKTRPLPRGPVQDGDPIFEETEGVGGLEQSFDKDLQGKPGIINVLFNADGTKADEQVIRRPTPGNNVVTTIDYEFQKYAENALGRHLKSGAMVIMEVKTGDIVAMASWPNYDINMWVPGMSAANWAVLNSDPRNPQLARAFRGTYPPASTFKVIVAQAALESGHVNAKTVYDCDPSLVVGDRVFHNWSKEPEGMMTVVSAIKRSCNTWFYQAGLEIGAAPITDMATKLGFGARTGIPINAEADGFVPTDAWCQQHLGHKMLGGDIANLSIGQGRTLVTPLQAAQAMAAIADGKDMPVPRLVSQIQDIDDHVLHYFEPQGKPVGLLMDARNTVRKGMVAVVNDENGTGKAAQIDDKFKITLAGKTGTAQWGRVSDDKSKNRWLAWFTGFLPANDPVYAYAVVYEGQPGESVSGGHQAAPIVHDAFQNYFSHAPPDDPVLLAQSNAKDAPKAVPVPDDDDDEKLVKTARKATPLEDEQPAEQAAPRQETGVRSFFRRLFGSQ
jgi:penicillin-binding protein 2